MAVRSARLVSERVVGGTDVEVYEAEPDRTVILKDIRAYNDSGGSVRSLVYVLSGPALVLIFDQDLLSGRQAGADRWVVLEPGDKIRCASLSGSTIFWISGTELAGVAP